TWNPKAIIDFFEIFYSKEYDDLFGFKVNQGNKKALKPSLFFTPHCEAKLDSNLLEANWKIDGLSKIALFGNSFYKYEEQVSFDQEVIHATKRIIAAQSS
ncbi:hypothetical protein ISN45_Aa06g000610, partial [Arabidopsis thaliana x Arabidopsis arenosa]